MGDALLITDSSEGRSGIYSPHFQTCLVDFSPTGEMEKDMGEVEGRSVGWSGPLITRPAG